ncbi:hypothetical protein J7337_001657 [Fusarium musae]|uniref:BTB domain-containing protein n=1 Tax=Fusarium musae TaxID=1042133 RepID=A0A9P8DTX6_9HYPO|nr:hypothetical protein J7337_001657 [Fusarium musae]KAG9508097.1 hypothetical protein J7337_001657 [Fusarium musae]
MAVVTHDIAPDGDLYIVLEKANTMRTTPTVDIRYVSVDSAEFTSDPANVKDPKTSSGLELPDVPDGDNLECRFRVSSHHLTFASPIFKTMLTGPWKESAPAGANVAETTPTSKAQTKDGALSETSEDALRSSSVREISTEGWDVHAFITVLRIIHGLNHQVPEAVSLSFFMDVAVIADYYQCTEAVSTVAKLWKPPFFELVLRGKVSIMWLWIAWVFSWPSEFKRAAYGHLRCSQGLELVDTHDLPIAMILEKLAKKREWSLETFSAKLDTLRADHLELGAGCDPRCREILLGAIQAGEYKMNNKLVVSGPPYHWISIEEINDIWEDIDSADCRDRWDIKRGLPRPCGLKKSMKPTFDEIVAEFSNINIADFQAKKV